MLTSTTCLLLAALLPASDIAWESSLEDTLARARSEGTVVFVAVNMDGERANERAVKELYRDARIRALSELTLNLVASPSEHAREGRPCTRFKGLECLDHRRVDVATRSQVLAPDADGYVVAPQHVFLAPSGEVLLSVPYEVTAAELEWCFQTALASVDPTLELEPSKGARAPRRLIVGDVYQGSGGGAEALAPTREQALELISELRRGLSGQEARKARNRLLLADEPEAVEYIRQLITGNMGRGRAGGRGGRGGGEDPERPVDEARIEMLHRIGVRSPASYWEVAAEFTTSSNVDLRAESAVALEQLAAPDSLKDVRSALAKERDPINERNWLRALASVGPDDTRVRKDLLKRAETGRDPELQLNAIVALGHLVPGEDVAAALAEHLHSDDPPRRAAAACAIGLSRDERQRESLEALASSPEGAEDPLRAALRAALTVFEKGSLAPLRAPLMDVAGDRIERERLFGGSGS